MKKSVMAGIVSLSLVAVPSVTVLANNSPSAQDVIKVEKNLKQAEQKLQVAKEKDATAKKKLKDGAFGFFADMGSEGKACLEILNDCKYSTSIQRGVTGDATTTENILKTFDRIRMGNLLRNTYELKGHPNAELKVTNKMMAMAMANADYSANVINHSYQFPVGENVSWGYEDPFDGWYWLEKGNYFLLEGKKFTPAMDKFFAKNPYINEKLDANGQTGHYFNVVNDSYKITGYAICTRKGTIYDVCEAQDFRPYLGGGSEKIYSVDEYEKLFTNWYQELKNSKSILKAAKEKTNTLKKEYNALLKKYYGSHITKKGNKYVMRGIKGEIVKNVWGEKDGKLYYAANDGYLITDRIGKVDNVYRGFDSKGAMLTGWGHIKSDTYYFDKTGKMLSKQWLNGRYLKSNGQMAKNEWIKDDNNNWYYMKASGVYTQNAWVGAYYIDANGLMAKNKWIKDQNNNWYYMNANGVYAHNEWVGVYYMEANGLMAKNKWIKDQNNNWYYMKANGAYARNEWAGAYYMESNGLMAKNKWIKDQNNNWYYMKANGVYARNEWVGAYYMDSNGQMAKNKWIKDQNNNWYYMRADGIYAHNEWAGAYYMEANGQMAKNKWIKDNTGTWYYMTKDGSYAA